ncbi:hypothetical protein GJAV_G00270970 [Gymnothorax javanicus]|nr:hypothetical protein GJAV_G00270970 [Gymnothorax javanicus]
MGAVIGADTYSTVVPAQKHSCVIILSHSCLSPCVLPWLPVPKEQDVRSITVLFISPSLVCSFYSSI